MVSEMTENLLMQDNRLRNLYLQYLNTVNPHATLKALEYKKKYPNFKLCAVLLIPRYHDVSTFESFFIGKDG